MRKLIFILPIFFAITCLAQKNPVKILGTVEIDKNASIDQTEVTIQEYLFFIINTDFNLDLFPNSQSIQPSARIFFDDLRTQKEFSFIELVKNPRHLQENYGEKGFKVTKKYKDLIAGDTTGFSIFNPIVGISFEQASKFCQWRENVVNLNRKVRLKITLPPLEVYIRINENSDSINQKSKADSCLRYNYNYSHGECISSKHKELRVQGKGLVRVDCFPPTKLKLYCVQGNAAEMTSQKGVAFGGSFRHFAKQSFRDSVQIYEKEQDWVGFRCYVTLN